VRPQFAAAVTRAWWQESARDLGKTADLDLAVDGALWAAFGTAGQRCTSAGNIIVDRRVLPTVREKLLRRARALRIGDPSTRTWTTAH